MNAILFERTGYNTMYFNSLRDKTFVRDFNDCYLMEHSILLAATMLSAPPLKTLHTRRDRPAQKHMVSARQNIIKC